MAKRATSSAGAVALPLLMLLLLGVGDVAATATATVEVPTSVWDAYPGPMLDVCPHIPRRPIAFAQLNGRWLVLEKGGFSRPQQICEIDFQVEEGQNLTLRLSQRAFNDRNLENVYNSSWMMTEDNVWRNAESRMFLFVGYSTARSLLLVCAVDDYDNSQDGYSFALSRNLYARASVLAAARLPGNVEATDRSHCPEA